MGLLAVVLLILGFGTFVLNSFGKEFAVLDWADDYQPWVSLGLGILGIVIIVVRLVLRRRAAASSEPTGQNS